MVERRIGDQTIRHDRVATLALYRTLKCGDADECGCASCRNFAVQRDSIYPHSFRVLLEELGIDPAKEGEVFEYGPVADGRHLYGGWFFLCGQIVVAGERNTDCQDVHKFSFWFSDQCPDAPAVRGVPSLLVVEFVAEVPWVLPVRVDVD